VLYKKSRPNRAAFFSYLKEGLTRGAALYLSPTNVRPVKGESERKDGG